MPGVENLGAAGAGVALMDMGSRTTSAMLAKCDRD